MTLSNKPTRTALASVAPDTALHGARSVAARMLWAALVLLSFGLFASGILAQFMPQFSFGALVAGDPRHLGAEETQALVRLGLSLNAYRFLYVAIDLLFLIAYCAVPFIITWRKSNDWMALAVSAALVMYGATLTYSFQTLLEFLAVPSVLPRSLNILSTASVPILAYLFPDGRFIPRWTVWLAGFWGVWALVAVFFPALDPTYWPFMSGYLLFLFGLGTAIYAQVYRYRRVSTLEQRQQTKWVIFGFGMATLGYAILPILAIIFPSLTEPGAVRVFYGIGFTLSVYLFQLAVPISMGLSILRYRLWDIDLVINRSIVYLIVTGILLVVFNFTSHFLQKFFQSAIGSDSYLAQALPALFLAMTIRPLRDRTQSFVDHRFYREKVDIQTALLEFSHEMRRIVDLSVLLATLIDRVSDLLHVTRSAVYLRDSDGTFRLTQSRHLVAEAEAGLRDLQVLERLENGLAVLRTDDGTFPLLIPLTLPPLMNRREPHASPLVAVLALGPRLSGQGYSREDQTLLLGLADQVGTAIYMTRMANERTAAGSQP